MKELGGCLWIVLCAVMSIAWFALIVWLIITAIHYLQRH